MARRRCMEGMVNQVSSKTLHASVTCRRRTGNLTDLGILTYDSIIAIHGLDTQSPGTWCVLREQGNPASGVVNWLEDLLPQDVPSARIYTYNWNAATHGKTTNLGTYLHDHAETLLLRIGILRQKDMSNRKIVFVASCFGGLLLAKVSWSSEKDKFVHLQGLTNLEYYQGTGKSFICENCSQQYFFQTR